MSYPIHTSTLPIYTGLPPPSYTLGRASQTTLLDLLHLLDLLDLSPIPPDDTLLAYLPCPHCLLYVLPVIAT